MTRQPTTFDKAAMENIPSTLPAPKDSTGSTMNFGTQVRSVVFHSASRATGVNRDHVSVVPTTPPLLPSPSQTSLLPSELEIDLDAPPSGHRRHRWQTQHAVEYGFNHLDRTPRPPGSQPPRGGRAILGSLRLH